MQRDGDRVIMLVFMQSKFNLFAMTDPAAVTNVFWDLKASELLKFISALVTALAWPVAAFLVVRLFKEQIIERIPKMAEVEFPGGLKMKFNDGLAKVEAVAEAENLAPVDGHVDVTEEPDTGSATAEVTPPETSSSEQSPVDSVTANAHAIGGIIVAWASLENALIRLADMSGFGVKGNLPTRLLIKKLRDVDVITALDEKAILELLDLRNLAAHSNGAVVTPDAAARFISMANLFRARLLKGSSRG